MATLGKTKAVTGLDLEAGSIAASEVTANGDVRLTNAGIAALPTGVMRDGEVVDPEALSTALKDLFAEHKLAKEVRLGVANQRVVVRVLRLPAIEKRAELETAIRFQAQDEIPMPFDQAVTEYEVVNRWTTDGGEPMMDVLVVAARREMVSPLVAAMRKAGLKPIGIDLSAFGMIRALAREVNAAEGAGMSYEERMASPGMAQGPAPVPATLYCNLGDVTNLAVAQGRMCLFTRVSQFGIEGIAQRLAERRGLTLEHARMWLGHVGLEVPVEAIDGDPEIVAAAREILDEGAAKLVDELRLSLEFYAAQEGALAVESVAICGTGVTIGGLPERIQRELGLAVLAPMPQALAHLDPSSAARLTLPLGLSIES